MTPLRSTIFGIATGIFVYIAAVLVVTPEQGGDSEATPSVSPTLAPVARGVTGDIRGANTVSPRVTPVSPVVAPVTPDPLPVTPWPSVSLVPSLSPSPTPSVVITPWPTPTPTPPPTASPTPTLTPSPTPTISPTPSPTPSPSAAPSSVVINEVAWSGTQASQYGEWIELFNEGDPISDLSGWTIYKGDTLLIALDGSIGSGDDGYFLIERVTDSSPDPIIDVVADVMGKFGSSGLRNTGDILTLRFGDQVVDTVALCGEAPTWCAGTASSGDVPYASMERASDGSWHSGGAVQVGADAGGNPINGTPRFENSAPASPQ